MTCAATLDAPNPTQAKLEADLLPLAMGALGVVYGDIGTSPLYALRESFHHGLGLEPTTGNVLGVLSLVLWSLVLVVCLKYLAFVVRADHHGEGGILALTAIVRESPAREAAGFGFLMVLGLFGTALLFGDGMITPAISVLSAVEGLAVATPFFEPWILPITVGILAGLFAAQSHGTEKVGRVFGPIMVVWFLALGGLGVVQIVQEPRVLTCLSPWQALEFFGRNGWTGFLVLGSVFLVVTGGEALYADMGHFGVRPIRLAWFTFVFPALMLNYLGQGALMMRQPDAIENPFFRMVPAWGLFPMVLLATAATVIASQALISGVFSLTMQAVQFGFLPRLKVQHTSDLQIGQIYVPFVNWSLMLACIGLVAGFGSSSNLAAAYGVAVTATMLITTLLFFYLARYAWGWSVVRAGLLCGLFLGIEVGFLGGNLLKIAHGGWFPLVVGMAFYLVMSTWRRGRAALARSLAELAIPWEGFLEGLKSKPPTRVAGTAIYLSGNPRNVPVALLSNLRHNHVVHQRVIVVKVETADRPSVPVSERVSVKKKDVWLFEVHLRFGYKQGHDVPAALKDLVLPDGPIRLQECTYFLGRETVVPGRAGGSGMAWWRERLFAVLSRNARNATYFFGLPPGRVFEVGNQLQL